MNTREILSDDEAQALREPARDEPGDACPRPAGEVVDLHADHWERIAADRLPALDSIMERMSSLLKLSGRRFFRQSVDITPQTLRDERWGNYVRRLSAPTNLNVFTIGPTGRRGVACLDADFVFFIADLFFGGDGKATRPAELLEFTQMEIRLVRKFVEIVLGDMREAWKPFIRLDLSLGNSEVNPIFAAVAAGSDTVVINGFTCTVAGREFRFDLVLPESLVEPIRRMQGAGAADGPQNERNRWETHLKTDVQDARVTLRAVLGHTTINLRDISQARPGDIIPLEAISQVTLLAGDTPLMEGTLGASRGRNAIRITRPANRVTVGEKYGHHEHD